ncbi:hypothetical protein, partial [Oceanimonas smirnovii]
MLKLRFNDFLVKASGELCEPERQEKILTWTGLLQLGVWLAIGKPTTTPLSKALCISSKLCEHSADAE